jgi:hypothetical protein
LPLVHLEMENTIKAWLTIDAPNWLRMVRANNISQIRITGSCTYIVVRYTATERWMQYGGSSKGAPNEYLDGLGLSALRRSDLERRAYSHVRFGVNV